jgi:predicted TIM-barrel fold metal-dependent hydrolase
MGSFNAIHFPAAEPAQMVRRMDRAGVRWLVFSHHASLSSPDMANAPAVAAVRAFPDRLRAYCVVNPHYPELVARDLAGFDAMRDVYVGLKLHAEMHALAYTDDRYEPAWKFADERGLPVLAHTWGGSPRCGLEVMTEVARRYPRIKLLLGHSLHAKFDEAIALAREHPNLYLDLCAVIDERSDTLERMVAGVGSEKILFGTDMPWFDYHYYLAGVLTADIDEAARRNILYRNADSCSDCGAARRRSACQCSAVRRTPGMRAPIERLREQSLRDGQGFYVERRRVKEPRSSSRSGLQRVRLPWTPVRRRSLASWRTGARALPAIARDHGAHRGGLYVP